MELVSRRVGEVLVVALAEAGAVEANNVSDFRQAIDQLLNEEKGVVINLGKIDFLDSSGVGAMVAIWRKISTFGGEMKLCEIGPTVRTVFEITRMHRIIEMFDTEEEALASFGCAK